MRDRRERERERERAREIRGESHMEREEGKSARGGRHGVLGRYHSTAPTHPSLKLQHRLYSLFLQGSLFFGWESRAPGRIDHNPLFRERDAYPLIFETRFFLGNCYVRYEVALSPRERASHYRV